jgi:hypothetical protein
MQHAKRSELLEKGRLPHSNKVTAPQLSNIALTRAYTKGTKPRQMRNPGFKEALDSLSKAAQRPVWLESCFIGDKVSGGRCRKKNPKTVPNVHSNR